MESNYGEILKNKKVMRNVVRSLATLAYADKRRAKFARTQLIAALKILQSGDIDESHLTGSWAGAMGHTQFIPTSYQAYAVDVDGDGRRDIWNSDPGRARHRRQSPAQERLAGRARPGATRSALPDGRKFPDGSMSLSKWQGLGVTRANGKPFKNGGDSADAEAAGRPRRPGLPDDQEFPRPQGATTMPTNTRSPSAFLPTRSPAMAVWSTTGTGRSPSFPSRRSRNCRSGCRRYGYYDGKFDGKIGEGSQPAIKAFQAQAGLTQDGHPSMEVLTIAAGSARRSTGAGRVSAARADGTTGGHRRARR